MGLKTFKYRLYPKARQERNLLNILACARNFYNMCLAERKWAYRVEGRSVSHKQLLQMVKHYKATFPQAAAVHSHILQIAATQCHKAFERFFARVREGTKKAGYPRFKSAPRFRSFGLKEYGNGWKIDGRKLQISGVGRVSVRWHRQLQGKPKTLRVIQQAGQWFVAIVCEVGETAALPKTGQMVGVDFGIASLLTTSDGQKIEHPHLYRNAQRRLRILQRSLARKVRGGKNRRKALVRLQRQHEQIANQRRDIAYKVSFRLVRAYDLIGMENLRINNMVRNKRFSKSILDAGWGIFKRHLTNKAVSAGRGLVFVDPAYTSKTCSSCGALFEHLTLADRWVDCACGLSLDRDVNAAINVLKRAHPRWVASVSDNAAPLSPPLDGEDKRIRRSEATPLQRL